MKIIDKLFGRTEPTLGADPLPAQPAGILDLTTKAGAGVNNEWTPSTLQDPSTAARERAVTRKIEDFPVVDEGIGDAALTVVKGGDSNGMVSGGYEDVNLPMSPMLAGWFASQGFIGHQMCAIIGQHWLVSKACAMPAEDAIRNGWTTDFEGIEDQGHVEELTAQVKAIDEKMGIDKAMLEAAKFANVFGIRILIPIIESDDPGYYQKRFNPDGVTPGSFKGWVQIDPQWIYPILSSVGASDPSSPNFYEPTFWQAGGVMYHHSHLVILRTEEVADILKPTYLFSGLPLTQRIAERVYAAERTANEAPLLAMSKRTTILKVDLAKAKMKLGAFTARIQNWVGLRDNYQVKVIGKDEEMTESDTSLADLDVVIMTQFQLVSAIARVPATKLMGTSPKGFGATGEHEMNSYHEYLESIQSGWFDSFLQRHYLLVSRAYLGGVKVNHSWEPVDAVGAVDAATIRKTDVDADVALIGAGVISPDEARTRIKLDRDSGYTLADEVMDLGGAEPGTESAAQAALSGLNPQAIEAATIAQPGAGLRDADLDGAASVEEPAGISTVGDETPQEMHPELVVGLAMQLAVALQKRIDANKAAATQAAETQVATVKASTVASVSGITPGVVPKPALPTPPTKFIRQ